MPRWSRTRDGEYHQRIGNCHARLNDGGEHHQRIGNCHARLNDGGEHHQRIGICHAGLDYDPASFRRVGISHARLSESQRQHQHGTRPRAATCRVIAIFWRRDGVIAAHTTSGGHLCYASEREGDGRLFRRAAFLFSLALRSNELLGATHRGQRRATQRHNATRRECVQRSSRPLQATRRLSLASSSSRRKL
uniref:Uncharacterized protein n=1 Tax=Trichogramma kaykai TaxID=54128 RepID=A0ABD2WZL4_9HYME